MPFSRKTLLHNLKLPLTFVAISLMITSVSRALLLLWQSQRVHFEEGITILTSGIRVDISTVSYLWFIPLLLWVWAMAPGNIARAVRQLSHWWMLIAIGFITLMELVTPTFISEYDLRPNRLAVEYLSYPKEVFSMLWGGYKTELALAISILAIVLLMLRKLSCRIQQPVQPISIPGKAALTLLLVVLCMLGGRSSLGHRPLNPAMVAFSNDHLLNELALNSSYSLAFAIKQMGDEDTAGKYYGKMDSDELLSILREDNRVELDYPYSDKPTMAMHQASYQGKPKNIVILLQESLGARYVGGLGGLPISPNLDQLLNEGWSFEHLYATGTRSVRGIEAVTTGFPPTPGRAVVKLGKSQQQFFSIAELLKRQGYHTQFIYGGEAHFDNMKSFFLGNGFTDIVDRPEFEQINFEGSWGASDEDLYQQAHREFSRFSKQEQPFFSLVFTSSNHSPYEFPDGKIDLFEQPKQTRANAAKYADYALGEFFKQARQSNYWKNTVFLVVADHDSRVFGAELVPIEHFRIPGVILGKGISARNDQRLVSQLDLAPTLLSLAGVSAEHPMIGHDLTTEIPEQKQRALMQYDKNFAWLSHDGVVVLTPGQQVQSFGYDFNNKTLTPATVPEHLVEKAKAYGLLGSMAYKNDWYRY